MDNLTGSAVVEVFAASPWLNGIAEVCADIRKRGERPVVITMSPDFFVRHLLELTRTVAANADHHLADPAAVSYVGNDLAEAYALGQTLLRSGRRAVDR